MKQSRSPARLSAARITQRALGRLDPFELKNRLIARASASARRSAGTLLNAGRGNPDWLVRTPRAAFHLLGRFALDEARAMRGPELGRAPDLGAAPRMRAIVALAREYLREWRQIPAARRFTRRRVPRRSRRAP